MQSSAFDQSPDLAVLKDRLLQKHFAAPLRAALTVQRGSRLVDRCLLGRPDGRGDEGTGCLPWPLKAGSWGRPPSTCVPGARS